MKNLVCYPDYKEAFAQIERLITYYMGYEHWELTKSDIWAFWRTLRCISYISCGNEVAILEDMYDSKMSLFNKGIVSKGWFVAYMTHTDKEELPDAEERPGAGFFPALKDSCHPSRESVFGPAPKE